MFDINKVFLVVDDFDPMRKVTINQLRAMGVSNILAASNGLEALRLLKTQRIDIVLSDWNMPVMSGLDLLKAMRADAKLWSLPFIMITAEAEGSQVREAISNGVTNLMLKPYTPNRLTAGIVKAFASRPRPGEQFPVAAALPMDLQAGAPLRQPRPAPETRTEPERPTILIVDDTPDNLLLLSRMFKDDYRVRLAQNGEKAVTICTSDSPPDLVLLDVMMPDMDGFAVITRLREHPTSESIPVIFVTAMTDKQSRHKGLELGAVDFVTKPVDPDTLKLRVRNFLRYVSLHKQLQASYEDMLDMAHLREDVEHISRHDLKGPLAGVIGMVQALIDDTATNPRQVPQLRSVEQTALEALNLVNLSSELLKIETGRFKLDAKAINVSDMLSRMVAVLQVVFREKKLLISVEGAGVDAGEVVHAQGDETLSYSMFNNLLKNACEASPMGARVTVSLTLSADTLTVEIANRGAVPQSIRERFFEKFVTSGKQGGTGLGTYSARRLAQAQHGDIRLDVSDADNLTLVKVSLPRR